METKKQLWRDTVMTSPTTDPDNSSGSSIDGLLTQQWISNIVGIPMFIGDMCAIILTLIDLLRSRSIRSTSFGMLLILLSVSDIGVLSTGLLRLCIQGLTWDRLPLWNVCQWCCKVHIYLTYVSVELSSWTLTLVTLERALAVTCPSKAAYLCTKMRMFGAWIAILVLVMSFNTIVIEKVGVASNQDPTMTQSPASTKFDMVNETVEVPDAYCGIVPPGDFFTASVMPVIFGLVGYVIPGIAILIMIIILRRRLCVGEEERRSVPWAASRLNPETRMLLGIDVRFILTNLPLAVLYVCHHSWARNRDLKNIIDIIMLGIRSISIAVKFVVALRDLVSGNLRRNGRDGWAEGRGRATTSNYEGTEFIALS